MAIDEKAFKAAQRRLTKMVLDGSDNFQPGGSGWVHHFIEAYEVAKAPAASQPVELTKIIRRAVEEGNAEYWRLSNEHDAALRKWKLGGSKGEKPARKQTNHSSIIDCISASVNQILSPYLSALEREEGNPVTEVEIMNIIDRAHIDTAAGTGYGMRALARSATDLLEQFEIRRRSTVQESSKPKRTSSAAHGGDAVELEKQIVDLIDMANEARGYLLERPCNKTKCNIMLLRMTQKRLAIDKTSDVELAKAAIAALPGPMPPIKRVFSEIAEEYYSRKLKLEDKLLEFGMTDWDEIGSDPYDNSIEFGKVDPDNRLSVDAQKYLIEEGFSRCWLNHKDGMETYYVLNGGEGSRQPSPPHRLATHADPIPVIDVLCEVLYACLDFIRNRHNMGAKVREARRLDLLTKGQSILANAEAFKAYLLNPQQRHGLI